LGEYEIFDGDVGSAVGHGENECLKVLSDKDGVRYWASALDIINVPNS
jgi:hypothetical protein